MFKNYKAIKTLKQAIAIFLIFFLFFQKPVFSDELEDIEKELNYLRQKLELSIRATKPLENQLNDMRRRLESIRERVNQIEKEIEEREKDLQKSAQILEQKEVILKNRIYNFYKHSRSKNLLVYLFSSQNSTIFFNKFFYEQQLLNREKNEILKIAFFIKKISEEKELLAQTKARLEVVKKELDYQAGFLEGEITKAKKYQAELKKKIAELTERQRQLIAQKQASLGLPQSLGVGPLYCVDDRKIDPGFSPAFAFFTFGIPHRVGMNQYGAYGRAKAGQSYKDILRAYYGDVSFEKIDPNLKIKVQGYGEMTIEEYLLGVYEMPESWGREGAYEALKAQVVAARSYAIAYTDWGKNEICTTQKCQVYKGGNKGGDWERAVRETEGEVMKVNGQVITAWYASTAGGYTFYNSDVWGGSTKPWTKRLRDTSGIVNSFEDLFNKAYDRDSPCFYAAQGWRKEYNKSAWLKPEEVADIANVILLARADPDTRKHLYQIDKPNPEGVDNWDFERVKQELKKRGITPFETVDSVEVSADFDIGRTTSVRISGSGKTESFPGDEFKNWFNLRAPANIQIVGPLYKVEKR